MKRLQDLSSAELAEEARRRAEQAKQDDARMGDALAGLLVTVEELTRRLDADE